MNYDSRKHQRRSIRLQGFDYSLPGGYFVTLCVQNRTCLLGEVVEGKMILNGAGQLVESCWHDLPNHYPHVKLDAFVVMPNHVHGIIELRDARNVATAKRHALPEIVPALKSFSARRINEYRSTQGIPVWQRNYYEHIVRGDEEWWGISQYIADNPAQWEFDRENPSFVVPSEPQAPEESWRV